MKGNFVTGSGNGEDIQLLISFLFCRILFPETDRIVPYMTVWIKYYCICQTSETENTSYTVSCTTYVVLYGGQNLETFFSST